MINRDKGLEDSDRSCIRQMAGAVFVLLLSFGFQDLQYMSVLAPAADI